MAVRADSTRLRRRLRGFLTTLPVAANAGLLAQATYARDRVKEAVRTQWADNTQVGFDLDNFLAIIDRIEAVDGGGLGLFNTERMGTADDFEKIRGHPRLWHQGKNQGERFGAFYNQLGMFFDQVEQLAQMRNLRWGETEPQWFLLEYGTLGSGAYAPQPPNPAIEGTLLRSVPRVFSVMEDTVTRMLRQRGIIA